MSRYSILATEPSRFAMDLGVVFAEDSESAALSYAVEHCDDGAFEIWVGLEDHDRDVTYKKYRCTCAAKISRYLYTRSVSIEEIE